MLASFPTVRTWHIIIVGLGELWSKIVSWVSSKDIMDPQLIKDFLRDHAQSLVHRVSAVEWGYFSDTVVLRVCLLGSVLVSCLILKSMCLYPHVPSSFLPSCVITSPP